jgi:hypothetical protein
MSTKFHSIAALGLVASISILSACAFRRLGTDPSMSGRFFERESGWTDDELATWPHPSFLEYRAGSGAFLTEKVLEDYRFSKLARQPEMGRPVTLDEYKRAGTPYKPTETVKVPGEVVFADYQLLRQDFPFLG